MFSSTAQKSSNRKWTLSDAKEFSSLLECKSDEFSDFGESSTENFGFTPAGSQKAICDNSPSAGSSVQTHQNSDMVKLTAPVTIHEGGPQRNLYDSFENADQFDSILYNQPPNRINDIIGKLSYHHQF